MIIRNLTLNNFRNYGHIDQVFPPGIIVLYGDNAQGKTSLIEAIVYLATSRSPYTSTDRQLINWEVEEDPLPFSRLEAEIETRAGTKRLGITMMIEKGGSGKLKKKIEINGAEKRTLDLLGHLRVVMFLPRDIDLIEGSPSGRRRYLDIALCQVDPAYCRALTTYNRVLSQRNALLKDFNMRGGNNNEEFAYWDQQLAENGAIVFSRRAEMIATMESRARAIHSDLSGGAETLSFEYQPGLTGVAFPEGLAPSFDTIEDSRSAFLQALFETRKADLRRGVTTTGPQRDEWRFFVNDRDLGFFGSRGQNRTAVLATKLSELDWMRETTGEWPVLLLDEVGAELDQHRRGYLMARIAGVEQAILTTAEPYLLDDAAINGATIWQITNGSITPLENE